MLRSEWRRGNTGSDHEFSCHTWKCLVIVCNWSTWVASLFHCWDFDEDEHAADGFDDFLLLSLVSLLYFLPTASRILGLTRGKSQMWLQHGRTWDGRGENIPGPSTQPWRTPKERSKRSDRNPSVLTSSSWLGKSFEKPALRLCENNVVQSVSRGKKNHPHNRFPSPNHWKCTGLDLVPFNSQLLLPRTCGCNWL